MIAWTESPKFKEYLISYVYPTAEWKKKTAELQPKFSKWSEETGINITNLYQLKSLGDTLYIDQLHHVALPKSLRPQDAQEIIAAGQWVLTMAFKSPEMGKNTGGALLKTIANYLQRASQQQTSLKYILLSSHDTTQLSLLSALSAPLSKAPPYASDLKFSLFDKGQENYYVKISFNGQPVIVPSCNNNICSLAKFIEVADTSM